MPEKEFTHRPTKLNRDVCFLHSGTCVFSFLVSDQGSKTHYLVKYNYIYIYMNPVRTFSWVEVELCFLLRFTHRPTKLNCWLDVFFVSDQRE